MDVEYCDGVVEWVWEDVTIADVSDCVLPYRGVLVDRRGEMCGVLGYVCMCGRLCCKDGLSEVMKATRFCMSSPYALCKIVLCD